MAVQIDTPGGSQAALRTAIEAILAAAKGHKNLIEEKTYDSSTTVFSFQSIPSTYAGGLLVEMCGVAPTGGATTMTFNNDTGAHYQWQSNIRQNGDVSSQNLTASLIQVMPAFTATFDCEVRLKNYASGSQKRVSFSSAVDGNNGSGSLAVDMIAGIWDNSTLSSAAINRIDFTFPSAPTTGSGFLRLYGIG